MPRSLTAVLTSAVAIAAVVGAVVGVRVWTGSVDRLAIVETWVEARNAGDVDAAMEMLGDDGVVLGYAMARESNREELAKIFRSQAIAGWRIEHSGCVVDDLIVKCRYAMGDEFMRRLGLVLTGRHSYFIPEDVLANADRVHDADARDAVYRAAEEFRAWVGEHHPELEPVIWSDRTATLYTTVAGAETMLAVLDEYVAGR
jgi:hypothetical protein